MDAFKAAVLGVVQGLTEFLPISSTAHLRLAPELFGWPDPGAAFSAVIQLGTVLAVILYFARDLGRLSVAFVRGLIAREPLADPESRLAWCVVLGTLPIGVLGLALKPLIEREFRSLQVIGFALIGLALVLLWAERRAAHRRRLDEITLWDGLWVGVWQALALVPGSSRSGTTLTGGLLRGLTREDAARFSFLLSVPATALAGVFELKHLLEAPDRPSTGVLLIGVLTAFVSGMAAIAGLLRFLKTHSTGVFIAYRVVLGGLLLGLIWTGRLDPLSGLENVRPARAAPESR